MKTIKQRGMKGGMIRRLNEKHQALLQAQKRVEKTPKKT